MRTLLTFAMIITLWACNPSAPGAERAAEQICSGARVTGRLPREIREASGIAASRRTPGIFWVHSDEPAPLLFAIDSTGMIRGRVRIPNVALQDWEDIAAGPCGNATCLFIADIGDNDERRARRTIYRVIEPLPSDSVTDPAAAISFHFPDRPHDAEALFVTADGRLYVITKGRSGAIGLYALPQQPAAGASIELEPIELLMAGGITLPDLVTGAGATPDGSFVVIRSYGAFQIFRFDGQRLTPVVGGHFDVQILDEVLGEGVDILDDGTVLLVSEDGTAGLGAPLSRVACALPRR